MDKPLLRSQPPSGWRTLFEELFGRNGSSRKERQFSNHLQFICNLIHSQIDSFNLMPNCKDFQRFAIKLLNLSARRNKLISSIFSSCLFYRPTLEVKTRHICSDRSMVFHFNQCESIKILMLYLPSKEFKSTSET